MPIAKMDNRTALVIGGGIVGLSCALALQRRGVAVRIVSPELMRGTASWGNAGHIAIEQVEPLASFATVKSFSRRLFWRGGALSLPLADIGAWLPFSLRLLWASRRTPFSRGKMALEASLALAMPAWRNLLIQADAPNLLIEAGHFIVWESAASHERGRAAWMAAPKGATSCRDATPGELASLQAHVARPIAGAVRFEGSGQIADPDALADALERRFLEAGGLFHQGEIASLRQEADGSVTAMLSDGEAIGADALIVAAGAASAPLMRSIGYKTPLIAERGYHIQDAAPDWPADMPPVVFEDRSMIVTRFGSSLRAASFVEFGRLGSRPDPRKWARLHDHAKALGLPIGADAKPWIGARPTFPDYLPAIGRSRRASNLYYAFGHQHLGLTLGPLTGEAIGALVTNEAPGLDLAPFDLERFG